MSCAFSVRRSTDKVVELSSHRTFADAQEMLQQIFDKKWLTAKLHLSSKAKCK
jgi:hypothetical protein